MTALTHAQAALDELRASDIYKQYARNKTLPRTHVGKCEQELLAAIADLQPAPAPVPGKVADKVGVYLGGSRNAAKLATYDKWLGTPTRFVLDFASGGDQFSAMPEGWVTDPYKASGKTLILSIPMPDSVTMTQIASGSKDTELAGMAQRMKAVGAWARPLWEMNGSWFRWYAGTDPQVFVAAWKKIAAPLIANGVPVIWSPNVGTPGGFHWIKAWPGKDYVTHIAPDTYNTPGQWNTITHGPGGLAELMTLARDNNLRFGFGEWGTDSNIAGGDDPEFITNMLGLVADPVVDFACYFDTQEKDGFHALSRVTIDGTPADNPLLAKSAARYRQLVAA